MIPGMVIINEERESGLNQKFDMIIFFRYILNTIPARCCILLAPSCLCARVFYFISIDERRLSPVHFAPDVETPYSLGFIFP